MLDGEADLAFEVSYEVLPAVELMDFKTLKLDKPVVEISEEDVDKEMQRVFRQNRGYEPKADEGVVENGDNLGLIVRRQDRRRAVRGRQLRPCPPGGRRAANSSRASKSSSSA